MNTTVPAVEAAICVLGSFATALHFCLGYGCLHSLPVNRLSSSAAALLQAKKAGSACSCSVSPNLRLKSCGFWNARLFAASFHYYKSSGN